MENQFLKELKPYLAVIFIQFGYAGTAIIAKSALNQGMNHYTFSVYRNIVATLIFAPFAFFLERKIRPQMTINIMLKITLLGLLEPVIDQNLYYTGMKYTTATVTSAMCNILPAITFILAWTLRLEKVNLKRLHDHAKIAGTLVTIGGAMIITLVAGPPIGFPWTRHASEAQNADGLKAHQQHIKGTIMITIGCFCWSLFYILQANTLKTYPAGLTLTTLICMTGAMQGTILTLVIEKGRADIWSVGWNSKIKLLAYAYAGIVSSGIGYYVSGYVSKEKGPVFATSFSPLVMVFVAVMSSFIFAEELDVGKVTGATVIVLGLYLVIWSRRHDHTESLCNTSNPVDENVSATSPGEDLKNDSSCKNVSQITNNNVV